MVSISESQLSDTEEEGFPANVVCTQSQIDEDDLEEGEEEEA